MRFETIKLLAAMTGAIWLLVLGLAYAFQDRLMYAPDTDARAPASVGLPLATVGSLATPDGEKLAIWQARAAPGKPTILYFHGNGGALTYRASTFHLFIEQGWGLLALSYRSFSGSTGRPSEAANVADAILAYDHLRRSGVGADDIVLFGESLGSGVAIQVAAARQVAALVLESPYSSIVDVARHRFWFLPVNLALRDRYESTRHVAEVTAPILILAGATDTIVPVEFSRRLAAAIPGVKRYVEYPDGWHINLLRLGGFEEMKAWIATHHGKRSAAVPR